MLSSMLPALACAVCPACLSTYAKALSVAGLSAWLSERQHFAFLTCAVALSLGFGFRRALKLNTFKPFAFTVAGCALLVLAHLNDESRWMTWSGLVALFIGGVYGQRLLVRAANMPTEARDASKRKTWARPRTSRPLVGKKPVAWRAASRGEGPSVSSRP